MNAELGYASVDGEVDEWGYGAVLAHPFGPRGEILFEIHGGADDDVLNFHVGYDHEITAALHLLASAGSSLRGDNSGEELDFDLFLGLQWFR